MPFNEGCAFMSYFIRFFAQNKPAAAFFVVNQFRLVLYRKGGNRE